ncbi:MAG: rod shape-determining protein RodA [Bacteroidaceae bacterium]
MAQVQDNTTSIFRSIDWWTILIYIVLLAMGWISVVGASYSFDNTDILDFSARSGKQLTWIGCSLVLGLILLLTDDRLFDTLANIIYVAMMALLLVTPFIATNIKGSYSWISLGAVNIQPAEFAKCATALALAGYMGSYNFTLEDRKKFLGALTMVLLPIVLIFLQRETGSALVYLSFFLVFYREGMSGSVLFVAFAAVVYFVVGLKFDNVSMPGLDTSVGTFATISLIWLFTLILVRIYVGEYNRLGRLTLWGVLTIGCGYALNCFMPQVKISWILLLLCVATAIYLIVDGLRTHLTRLLLIGTFTIGSLAMFYSTDYVLNNVLQPHQQQRVKVLLGLEEDLAGAGYNVHQSEIAIGSGGFWGKGFLNGTQTKLKYVPEQDTDFIFCTVGEEHGFVGCTIVLLLFLALILRLIHVAERQTSKTSRIYGYCVVSIFLFHIFINIGMVMGITPVIGIPLPFFSYGGSSLWGFTLLLFIFLRMDAARNKYRR